jgi:hypothetical protein
MNTDSITTAVLTAVRRAVDETTPAVGADAGLPQVLTAARARRRRRRVTACGGAAGTGLAVGAALALALGAPGAGPRVNPGGTAAQAGMTGTANPSGTARGSGTAGTSVSLAAWSVQADGGGRVTVALRELADAAQLKQALAANGVPALLHFGRGPCSADRAPQRAPIGLVRVRAAGGHLTFTMTFKVSWWPAGSELYIANGPLGPQLAVIPQGHYQGCA